MQSDRNTKSLNTDWSIGRISSANKMSKDTSMSSLLFNLTTYLQRKTLKLTVQ